MADRAAFIQQMTPYAQRWAQQTGIPAEVFLAIMGSESNFGAADSLFGIKGAGPSGKSANYATQEVINGQRVNINDQFAAYDSPDQAFQHFAGLISQGRYAPAWTRYQQTGDWQALLNGINQAGYATDPNWAKMIAELAADISKQTGGVATAAARTTNMPQDPSALPEWARPIGGNLAEGVDPVTGVTYQWQYNPTDRFDITTNQFIPAGWSPRGTPVRPESPAAKGPQGALTVADLKAAGGREVSPGVWEAKNGQRYLQNPDKTLSPSGTPKDTAAGTTITGAGINRLFGGGLASANAANTTQVSPATATQSQPAEDVAPEVGSNPLNRTLSAEQIQAAAGEPGIQDAEILGAAEPMYTGLGGPLPITYGGVNKGGGLTPVPGSQISPLRPQFGGFTLDSQGNRVSMGTSFDPAQILAAAGLTPTNTGKDVDTALNIQSGRQLAADNPMVQFKDLPAMQAVDQRGDAPKGQYRAALSDFSKAAGAPLSALDLAAIPEYSRERDWQDVPMMAEGGSFLVDPQKGIAENWGGNAEPSLNGGAPGQDSYPTVGAKAYGSGPGRYGQSTMGHPGNGVWFGGGNGFGPGGNGIMSTMTDKGVGLSSLTSGGGYMSPAQFFKPQFEDYNAPGLNEWARRVGFELTNFRPWARRYGIQGGLDFGNLNPGNTPTVSGGNGQVYRFANGGAQVLDEPVVGMGMMSGEPKFMAGEGATKEMVSFTPMPGTRNPAMSAAPTGAMGGMGMQQPRGNTPPELLSLFAQAAAKRMKPMMAVPGGY